MVMAIRADVKYTRAGILRKINKLNQSGKPYSVAEMANQMGIGEATVYRHLKALRLQGYILTDNPEKGCGRKTNLYTITDEGKEKLNDDL
jgi:predicted ArsR family transcriptional regulator